MPVTAPRLSVPNTATTNGAGWPLCVKCQKRLRAMVGGYGYNGNGHFCSMRCAAEWADLKVETVT
jgi:hypothetical protein